ncbi:unnamed protein product [Somion occarium]|uniref:Glycoside hydrolase family 76 protein n=1 Tax=Somion occarium TaxID=3059160 RepID=A0ABP1E0G2_9APHY
MFLDWLVLCSLTCSTFAQIFSIPSGWRKPTSNIPWQDTATLSQALIDAIAPQIDASTGQVDALDFEQNASLFAAIANYDRLVGNKANEALVTTHLVTVGQQRFEYYGPSFSTCLEQSFINVVQSSMGHQEGQLRTTYSLTWALAAVSAYRAYGDQYLLDLATSIWNKTSIYMITFDDTLDGGHSHFSTLKPGLTLVPECDGSSVEGSVFVDMENKDVEDVDLYSVGAFLSLSVYMYEATHDGRYSTAADTTSHFMAFLENHLDLGLINMSSCDTLHTSVPISQSVGPAIEGLGVYAARLKNPDLASQMQTLILGVIGKFVNGDGIFDQDIGDTPLANTGTLYVGGVLVRGLYEILSRIDASSELAKLVQSFLAVQFNAVLDLARPPNSTLFSSNWRGPPMTDRVLPWGQLLALDVLNAGLSMTPRPTPNTNTSTLPLPSPTFSGIDPSSSVSGDSSGTHLSIKGIVGIIVGGIAVVTLIVVTSLVALWQRSKRNRTVSQPPTEPAPPQPLDGEEQYYVTDIPRFLPVSAMYQLPSSQVGSSETSTMMPSSEKRRSAVVLSYASTSNNAMDGPDVHRSASPLRPPSVEESIPDLVQRLNRAMTRLPPSGAGHAEELEPPQYESTAYHTVV